jgi:hypothetical protein
VENEKGTSGGPALRLAAQIFQAHSLGASERSLRSNYGELHCCAAQKKDARSR